MKPRNISPRKQKSIYRQQWDTLQDVYTKHKIFIVYEMFIVEVVKRVFKQLRLESPRLYLDTGLAGHD